MQYVLNRTSGVVTGPFEDVSSYPAPEYRVSANLGTLQDDAADILSPGYVGPIGPAGPTGAQGAGGGGGGGASAAPLAIYMWDGADVPALLGAVTIVDEPTLVTLQSHISTTVPGSTGQYVAVVTQDGGIVSAVYLHDRTDPPADIISSFWVQSGQGVVVAYTGTAAHWAIASAAPGEPTDPAGSYTVGKINVGAAGPTGAAGPSGTPGSGGIDGVTGATGPAGSRGATGVAGPIPGTGGVLFQDDWNAGTGIAPIGWQCNPATPTLTGTGAIAGSTGPVFLLAPVSAVAGLAYVSSPLQVRVGLESGGSEDENTSIGVVMAYVDEDNYMIAQYEVESRVLSIRRVVAGVSTDLAATPGAADTAMNIYDRRWLAVAWAGGDVYASLYGSNYLPGNSATPPSAVIAYTEIDVGGAPFALCEPRPYGIRVVTPNDDWVIRSFQSY